MGILKIGTVIYDKYEKKIQYWVVRDIGEGFCVIECIRHGRIRKFKLPTVMSWYKITSYNEKWIRLLYE